jgi:hypothetical protein
MKSTDEYYVTDGFDYFGPNQDMLVNSGLQVKS